MSYLSFIAGVGCFIAAGVLFSMGRPFQGFMLTFVGVLYFVSGLDGLNEE